MGLMVSDAIRVFLTRVATDQAFPFPLRGPNAETQEARAMNKARFNKPDDLFNALESE